MRLGLGLGINKGRRASGSLAETVIANLESQAASDGYTAFSGATKDASLVMVESLVAAGVWSKLDLFYVFATNGDSDFATYNWVNPSTFKATKNNNPTFTSLEGFTGNGTNMWLNCNFNPRNGDGDNFSLNSASFGYYCRSVTSGFELNIMGDTEMTVGTSSNNFYYRVNALGPNNTGVAGNLQGFLHGDRDSSNSDQIFRNGSSVASSATAATAMPNQAFLLRGGGGGYTSKQLSIYFTGSSLADEASDFYNAVQTYMSSIGKQV